MKIYAARYKFNIYEYKARVDEHIEEVKNASALYSKFRCDLSIYANDLESEVDSILDDTFGPGVVYSTCSASGYISDKDGQARGFIFIYLRDYKAPIADSGLPMGYLSINYSICDDSFELNDYPENTDSSILEQTYAVIVDNISELFRNHPVCEHLTQLDLSFTSDIVKNYVGKDVWILCDTFNMDKYESAYGWPIGGEEFCWVKFLDIKPNYYTVYCCNNSINPEYIGDATYSKYGLDKLDKVTSHVRRIPKYKLAIHVPIECVTPEELGVDLYRHIPRRHS